METKMVSISTHRSPLETRNCKNNLCRNTWKITPSHSQEYCSNACEQHNVRQMVPSEAGPVEYRNTSLFNPSGAISVEEY